MGEFPAKLGISFGELMDLGRENPGSGEKFCMSVFACNTCQEVNGVSWLHGKVSQRMFQPIWKGYSPDELHVSYVTNGVHMPTWAASEWKEFYVKHLGEEFLTHQNDRALWQKIYDVPDEDIWKINSSILYVANSGISGSRIKEILPVLCLLSNVSIPMRFLLVLPAVLQRTSVHICSLPISIGCLRL